MRTYLGLFVVALTALVVEVLLTRIFDVIMWPNIAFVIISCAMFGLGLGGLYELLRPSSRPEREDRTSLTALLFAVSIWMLPLLLNAIPFSLSRVAVAPLSQTAWFLVLYGILLTPFFCAGLCVCRLFSSNADDSHRLYFWDLSGAALGTVALVPLLPTFGPERLLLMAGVAGLVASALFSDSRSWRLGLVAVGVLFVASPALLGSRYLTLALHDDKRDVERAIEHGRLEFSRWILSPILDHRPVTRRSDRT